MRGRQPYTPVKIYVDGLRGLAVGDYIKTPGGSGYLVQAMSQSPTRPQRWYLKCLRWPIDEFPADGKVYTLHWYPRKRKLRNKPSFDSAMSSFKAGAPARDDAADALVDAMMGGNDGTL